MLTKKEILEKLESMKEQACHEVVKDIEVQRAEERARIESAIKLEEFAHTLEAKFSDILSCLEEFKTKAESFGCRTKPRYYGSIEYTADHLTSGMVERLLMYEIELNSPQLKSLNSKECSLRSVIADEWNKVINNCRALSRNKDCVKYLVSIGFDENLFNTTEACTTLMVPVNTALLFRKEKIADEVD